MMIDVAISNERDQGLGPRGTQRIGVEAPGDETGSVAQVELTKRHLVARVPALFFPAAGGAAPRVPVGGFSVAPRVTQRLRKIEHRPRIPGIVLQRCPQQTFIAHQLLRTIGAVGVIDEVQPAEANDLAGHRQRFMRGAAVTRVGVTAQQAHVVIGQRCALLAHRRGGGTQCCQRPRVVDLEFHVGIEQQQVVESERRVACTFQRFVARLREIDERELVQLTGDTVRIAERPHERHRTIRRSRVADHAAIDHADHGPQRAFDDRGFVAHDHVETKLQTRRHRHSGFNRLLHALYTKA